MTKQRLLVLVGPTAVGKTSLSLELAKAWNAEIISGDSMQVYRGMDIGTAKITPAEMKGIPHHLIDVRHPAEPYSAADFQAACATLIPEIAARGKLPFIVGGTGLYIESVCYGYQFSEARSDERFRGELQSFAEKHGAEALHARLREADPDSALKLHANDTRRVIRALEILHVTGETMSRQLAGQKKESPYELCMLGLTMDRAELYRRIEQRIDAMMAAGLPEEVSRLLDEGVPETAVAMQGLGYKELIPWLKGDCTRDEAVTLLKRDTRRFAKRQLSWFRHMKDIHWLNAAENFHNHLDFIHAILAGKLAVDLEYTTNQSFHDGGNFQ